MKTKIALVLVVILAAASIVLFINLNDIKTQAAKDHEKAVTDISFLSNRLNDTSTKLTDETKKNVELDKDLSQRNQVISKLSNDLAQTTETLSKTSNDLKLTQEEVAKRDAKISELESKNESLDKQALDLKSSITSLEDQIGNTKKKLEASEGDKAFLTKELNRLIAEKADLEKKFNDLAILKEQVSKLKEELSAARRLDWIRRGIFAGSVEKGASKLMSLAAHSKTNETATTTNVAPGLNVELKSSGDVKVVAPATNQPPAAPVPPAK